MTARPTTTDPRDRRAWLRVLLTFAGAVAIWLLVDATVTALLGTGDYTRTSHVLRAALVLVLALALLAAITRAFDGAIPRPRPGWLREALLGAGLFLVPAGVAAALLGATGTVGLERHGSVLQLVGSAALLLALVLAYEAVPEELIVRGVLQTALSGLLGRWLAVLGQAVLFVAWAVAIGAAATVDRVVMFFVFSLVQGLIRMWSGTVAATIGFHAAFQLVSQGLSGASWPIIELVDPDRWFDVAYLAAAVLAPVGAWLVWGRRGRARAVSVTAAG